MTYDTGWGTGTDHPLVRGGQFRLPTLYFLLKISTVTAKGIRKRHTVCMYTKELYFEIINEKYF